MGKKTLEVEISDNLHERLYRIVPDPAFLFRNTKETAYRAIERAVELAVTQFLETLKRGLKQVVAIPPANKLEPAIFT